MTPRPHFTHKQRPLSAIFIGSLGSNSTSSTASPPDLPKLPEPLASSPGSSSGLPSPPATNSTGSGSIGDESTNTGSVRQRTSQRPLSTSNMYNGPPRNAQPDASSSSTLLDDDDEHNDENDEDNTARFNSSQRPSSSRDPSADNMSALQRVKSLTERNRLVLDKLTSISRLGSPVPRSSSKASLRSPLSNTNAPSPSLGATSSRLSTPSRLATSRPRPQSSSKLQAAFPSSSDDRADPGHSGSETERESTRAYSHAHSSSDSMSNTPTSTYAPSDFVRPRQISAPDSPAKSPRKNRRTSPGPSRTPRKRASMAVSVSDVRRDYDEDVGDEDVTKAALAAVASSRRSPGSVSKRNTTRQALPREFRDRDRRSVIDDRPTTPQRERFLHTPRSPSPTKAPSGSNVTVPTPFQSIQRSPRRPGAARVSTVRELTRRHQTRWMSEDLSAMSVDADTENDAFSRANDGSTMGIGRRQTLRTGSAESPFTGRTLVGEELRAAGLTKRRELPASQGHNGDVFVNGRDAGSPHDANGAYAVIPTRRTRSTGATALVNGQGEWDSPSPSTASGRNGIGDGGHSLGSFSTRTQDVRTPGSYRSPNPAYVTPARPGTSMAAFHTETPSASASRSSRSYRSPYEREATSSAATLDEPIQLAGTPHGSDRPHSSLFSQTPRLPHDDGHPEHHKLLLDALGMFESQLSRLPPMGHTTTSTIPEVFQNSQSLVHSLDRLNEMLRVSTHRAAAAQVQAEVDDIDPSHINLVQMWSEITNEHRDNLRVTEEIIRTMTLFFLGVGRVLRETTMAPGASLHSRTMSLEEDAARRMPPEATRSTTSSDRRSGDGRLSRETRRSWEPRSLAETRAVARLASRERPTSRPSSTTQPLAHSSAASSSEGRSVVDNTREQTHTPLTARSNGSSVLATATRRFSPRDPRPPVDSNADAAPLMASMDSLETLHPHDPSPTPSSRPTVHHERTRTLPPLSIPPSLPPPPNQSMLRRTGSVIDRPDRVKKISTSSNVTVRADSLLPPVIKPANTTTALTTDSPIEFDSGLSRTNSTGSTHTNGVTFSRPSPRSVSALSGLQQQHDTKGSRHRVASSVVESPVSLRSPMSGSETERPRMFTSTIASRGRASLDRPIVEDGSGSSRASTTRRTRSRTITSVTDIFSHAHDKR